MVKRKHIKTTKKEPPVISKAAQGRSKKQPAVRKVDRTKGRQIKTLKSKQYAASSAKRQGEIPAENSKQMRVGLFVFGLLIVIIVSLGFYVLNQTDEINQQYRKLNQDLYSSSD